MFEHTDKMNETKTYTDDLKIARALIDRESAVTRTFFYKQCYPLFKSIYDNYHTDCSSCIEFINEIYIVVLSPSAQTGKCQMENFRGESTLASWLKSACIFYCYNKYKRKERMPMIEQLTNNCDENDNHSDRYIDLGASCEMDCNKMNQEDVNTILELMPNKRYKELIKLRYLESKSNEEVASIMGVDMDNYYNLHKRAKSQYERVYRKEEYYA